MSHAEGPGKRSRAWRILALLLVLAVIATVALVVVLDRAQPDEPDAFYDPPTSLPDEPPGTILRQEVIDGYQPGATTYRVLYLSTGHDGKPTAVSGLVLVPDGEAPAGGREVLAYAHGTVGVAERCAPSLAQGDERPVFFEGGAEMLEAGYVIAATDYEGLGTPGPHPYLVGDVEGENVLDSVRAARNLAAADAGARFAVWGHSQGGHASLFTGQLAASYAPELDLVGVAAGAPVPDLVDLFEVNVETKVGKILIAMALDSWARVYDAASLDQIVTRTARPVVRQIARNCIYNPTQILASVPGSLILDLTFLSAPPWEAEPWASIVGQNDPSRGRSAAPLLITQGADDPIVDPSVTKAFVAEQCASGSDVELSMLADTAHLDAGAKATPQVLEWIADRFAGRPTTPTC
ncbi:lipase family protein [soil metagenome]